MRAAQFGLIAALTWSSFALGGCDGSSDNRVTPPAATTAPPAATAATSNAPAPTPLQSSTSLAGSPSRAEAAAPAPAPANPAPQPRNPAAQAPAPAAQGAGAGDLRNAVMTVAEKVRPAVTFISVRTGTQRGMSQSPEGQGVGSGVIYDPSGLILTNNHVVEGGNQIRVTLPDDRTFDARLIGRDPQTDLAVIKIDGTNLPTAPLGNSDTLKIGEWVVAIGNALGLEGGPTVTVGVVGALNRSLEEPTGAGLYDLIQTDAPINPGNSGGPLVNLNGEVVGVNTAVARSPVGGQAAGIGFSIAVNSAKPISDQIIANGRVIRPYLGIAPITVTAALASRYDLPVQKGVVIARVDRTTPAGRAGLLVGDVIVDIDGQKIGNERDLRRALERKRPGETARVTVVRENGQQAQVNVTLGETPRS